MMSMSPRLFRKTKSYTAISLALEGLRNWGKTQTRGKKNRRAKPSGIVRGGKRVQAVHAIFMPFQWELTYSQIFIKSQTVLHICYYTEWLSGRRDLRPKFFTSI